MMQNSYNQRGFTLMETLIAVLLLGVLMSGAAALAQQTLQIATKLKIDTAAIFLAQEGMELVRYQRDSNRLAGNGWMDGLLAGNFCGSANGCTAEFDITTGEVEFENNCGGGCPHLRLDPITKIYNYTTGPNTVYRRTIKIENVGGTVPEVKVIVSISWNSRFGSRTYSIEENLLDWQ